MAAARGSCGIGTAHGAGRAHCLPSIWRTPSIPWIRVTAHFAVVGENALDQLDLTASRFRTGLRSAFAGQGEPSVRADQQPRVPAWSAGPNRCYAPHRPSARKSTAHRFVKVQSADVGFLNGRAFHREWHPSALEFFEKGNDFVDRCRVGVQVLRRSPRNHVVVKGAEAVGDLAAALVVEAGVQAVGDDVDRMGDLLPSRRIALLWIPIGPMASVRIAPSYSMMTKSIGSPVATSVSTLPPYKPGLQGAEHKHGYLSSRYFETTPGNESSCVVGSDAVDCRLAIIVSSAVNCAR